MNNVSLFSIIATPLLGMIIGWITNDLAIKMLFRPRKRYMIGRWHVPFTPGLIPSQKSRIAKSIGKMVSHDLLDESTIRQMALSEATQAKLREKASEWLNANARSTDTVGDVLARLVDSDTVDIYREKLNNSAASFALKTAAERNLGKQVCDALVEKIRQKVPFLSFMDDKALASLKGTVASAINDYLQNHGGALIKRELEHYEQDLMQKRICDLTERGVERIPELVDALIHVYRSIFEEHLGTILRVLNIGSIVENKINQFRAEELEGMIFGIMKKELNAIVLLGAVLGFMMGFVNLALLFI